MFDDTNWMNESGYLWQVTVVSDEVCRPQIDFLQGLLGEGSDLARHLCLGRLLKEWNNGKECFNIHINKTKKFY